MIYKYNCVKCGYYTNIKQHYDNHNISKKHTQKTNEEFIFNCLKCNKKFITVGGLNKHKKKCNVEPTSSTQIITPLPQQNSHEPTTTINEIEFMKYIENNKEKILKVLLNVQDNQQLIPFKNNNELIKFEENNLKSREP
jgi:hypothetical protein